MIVLICGSRNITDIAHVEEAIKLADVHHNIVVTHTISGGARGVDKLAEEWSAKNNITCTVMRADWNRYGRHAGFIRNVEMVKKAEACIAVWDGKSNGTRHSIETAKSKGIPTYVYIPKYLYEPIGRVYDGV